ncbi:MAG: hypothetical protein SFW36_05470 [Leptolyngbyaceae cyanobacterium bins.59]|nr:hypothetical protein [Leptolyngbyaceae cyanobacterium bins.59]
MKKFASRWMLPVATALLLAPIAPAYSETIQIGPNFKPDPQVLSGTSGGNKNSDCGSISAAPNQVIQVREAVPYLRLNVQGAGQPTLLVEGPQGRFCVLANAAGGGPKMAGFWGPGNYSVFIGDRGQGRHPYTLSLTQTPE